MKNVTKIAKKSAGLSQKCSICPLMQRCTLEIHRACFDSFVEGFKKGARAGKRNKQEIQIGTDMKQTTTSEFKYWLRIHGIQLKWLGTGTKNNPIKIKSKKKK